MLEICIKSKEGLTLVFSHESLRGTMMFDIPEKLERDVIPLAVTDNALQKIHQWCNYQLEYQHCKAKVDTRKGDSKEEEKSVGEQWNEINGLFQKKVSWELNFLEALDTELLYELIDAADCYDLVSLFNMTCFVAGRLLRSRKLASVTSLCMN